MQNGLGDTPKMRDFRAGDPLKHKRSGHQFKSPPLTISVTLTEQMDKLDAQTQDGVHDCHRNTH